MNDALTLLRGLAMFAGFAVPLAGWLGRLGGKA